MKFQDIPTDLVTIRVRCTEDRNTLWGEQPVRSLDAHPRRKDEFELFLHTGQVVARPVSNADIRRLQGELSSGRSMIAQLANPAKDGSLELQIAFFVGECLDMGSVDIGVDEHVENEVRKHGIKLKAASDDGDYPELSQRFSISMGELTYFFLNAGAAIEYMLKESPSDTPKQKGMPGHDTGEDADDTPNDEVRSHTQDSRPLATRENSFAFYGDGIRFVASIPLSGTDDPVFTASRWALKRNERCRSLRLAVGKLRFVDRTQAGYVSRLVRGQMGKLTSESGSYLKKWDEFGDLEGELLLNNARQVGALIYDQKTQERDGMVSVRIIDASDAALKLLEKGQVPELQDADELPAYLADITLSFAGFCDQLEASESNDDSNAAQRKQDGQNQLLQTGVFDPASRTLKLRTENLPRDAGTLIVSLAGEMAQIKRRMAARRRIMTGQSANPQLGLLIEENGQIMQARKLPAIKPLTAFVRSKVFKTAPTVNQERAVEIALNTPDIALIQGPPGTGKTTVIAAILERLNELADKRGTTIRGRVLLTGFQHDAVENMIERISLNGLPVLKVGKSSAQQEDGLSLFERRLDAWCGDLASALRKRAPRIAEIEQEMDIRHFALQYVQSPSRTLAAHLAGKIATLGITILGEDDARLAADLARQLAFDERLNSNGNRWLGVVRCLRVHPGSFADDGPQRAADVLDDLTDVLDDDESALLKQASLWPNERDDPPFLPALRALKRQLLLRFSAPPVFRVEKQHSGLIALTERAITSIQSKGCSGKDLKSAALAHFLAELEGNPQGLADAMAEYSFAFAATCQQSVNRQMQAQKGLNKNQSADQLEYDYVIVDEAARVSPRDLMVPMAQGKRIILVGDHRQLPHLIEEEVVRRMEAGEPDTDESAWLKKSMFEYLFSERLQALQDNDGIRRRVTLDKQFRMHPVLGDFISRNFYARFNEKEKFSSGRPELDFAHQLEDTDGKPAIWLDLPFTKGKQERSGTSWTRSVEAIAIAELLKRWMQSEAGKDLSFGVISFYKAQAEMIQSKLSGLTDDPKRLRIGTVDAFQGMEFDVVFLSMVRTCPSNERLRGDTEQKQVNGLFGHLALYNRLNVSMSRQKKLLVVVGDSGLVRHELANKNIPGLVDFFNLCHTSDGKVL